MKCLRYELGLETARRELAEAEVARLTEARATERDALRAELRMERAHSARCELWVGAMRTDARHYLAQIKQREWLLARQKVRARATTTTTKRARAVSRARSRARARAPPPPSSSGL